MVRGTLACKPTNESLSPESASASRDPGICSAVSRICLCALPLINGGPIGEKARRSTLEGTKWRLKWAFRKRFLKVNRVYATCLCEGRDARCRGRVWGVREGVPCACQIQISEERAGSRGAPKAQEVSAVRRWRGLPVFWCPAGLILLHELSRRGPDAVPECV